MIGGRFVLEKSFGEGRERPDLAHAKHTSAQERIWGHRVKRRCRGKIGRKKRKFWMKQMLGVPWFADQIGTADRVYLRVSVPCNGCCVIGPGVECAIP